MERLIPAITVVIMFIGIYLFSIYYNPYHPCNIQYYGEIALAVTYNPSPGDKVNSPIKVSGCSRSFESTIHYKLVARDGTILTEGGETAGGGVDGPGIFRLSISYDKTKIKRALNPALLIIEEDDPSDGEGFPPTRTVTPLLLQ